MRVAQHPIENPVCPRREMQTHHFQLPPSTFHLPTSNLQPPTSNLQLPLPLPTPTSSTGPRPVALSWARYVLWPSQPAFAEDRAKLARHPSPAPSHRHIRSCTLPALYIWWLVAGGWWLWLWLWLWLAILLPAASGPGNQHAQCHDLDRSLACNQRSNRNSGSSGVCVWVYV